MASLWLVVCVLATATFAIRLGGVYLGQKLPQHGGWARALNALPGCVIVALVSVQLLTGGLAEWLSGAVATAVAIATKSLPLTMVAGILAVWLFRQIV